MKPSRDRLPAYHGRRIRQGNSIPHTKAVQPPTRVSGCGTARLWRAGQILRLDSLDTALLFVTTCNYVPIRFSPTLTRPAGSEARWLAGDAGAPRLSHHRLVFRGCLAEAGSCCRKALSQATESPLLAPTSTRADARGVTAFVHDLGPAGAWASSERAPGRSTQ